MSRYSLATAILGEELMGKLKASRVLMVGAGGIGCELLKNLVTTGFGHIEIIDLDTIDLSNLNRQFLFRKEHVKRPKSIVARETASQFNPDVEINAIHGNIKDPQYDVEYFKSFDLVMNALDNLDARRHVNKMCVAADTPLIESGTAGFRGQVEPMRKDITTCYDCTPKETPKTFPICTIRSTPSTPIHCIVWAKSYLFPQLFGPDDETDADALDKAAADGENVSEIAELKKEAQAIKEIRATLGEPGSVKRVFEKVFTADIERLLKMEDMWRSRQKPVPLSYDTLSASASQSGTSEAITAAPGTLRDQRELSVQDSFELFLNSFDRLTQRTKTEGQTLDWDKDDEDALDFATSAANLRATAFDIARKTRFDVKQMAGNIIPAIATTNAIVGGLIVLQALRVLQGEWTKARTVWVARMPDRALSTTKPSPPEPGCAVCRTPYLNLPVDVARVTLSMVIERCAVRLGYTGDGLSITEGARVLFDPDFDDNAEKTLAELGLTTGAMLTVADEDGDLASSVLILAALPAGETEAIVVPSSLPRVPTRPPPTAEEEEVAAIPATTLKRKAEEAELDADARAAGKKVKRDADDTALKTDAKGVILLDDDEEPTANGMQVDGQTNGHTNGGVEVIDLD